MSFFRRFSWYHATAVWWRDVAVYRKTWKMNLFPNFFEPFLYLLSMGFGLGRYVADVEPGVPYLLYLAPGLLASQAMNGASFEVTYNVFIKMNFGRLYDAVLATPVSAEDIALGELLWAVTRAMIYGSIFFLILALYGAISTPAALLCIPALLLVGALFAATGLAFTAVNPTIEFYTYYWTLFLTPMFLFSGIFYPLGGLPGWAQAAAWATPLYHAVALVRALFMGRFSWAIAIHVAYIVALTAVLFWFAATRFRRRLVA